MKVLIIERDEVAAQLLKSKLIPMGYEVFVEINKNEGLARLSQERFDILFLDPSPLKSGRSAVFDIRRTAHNYSYIFLTMPEIQQTQALRDGFNDVFPKPFATSELEKKMKDAERMLKLMKQMGDDSTDFPSSGGVIAKSAFNQLFLSGIDRAGRYGEKTYILFISVANYDELLKLDGKQGADYTAAMLSKQLVLTRRQSDIIGQIAKNEYALMLQRPSHDNEPIEATNRFAETVANGILNESQNIGPAQIRLSLLDIPVGSKVKEHVLTIARRE